MYSSISKEALDELPHCHYNGPVTIVDNNDQIADAIKLLKKERVLGFDTETKPSFRKGEVNMVSLLQLASPTDVFLFRLNKCGLSSEIVSLLESPSIMKIGVGIRDDLRALRKLGHFTPCRFVELQDLVKSLGMDAQSLKGIAGNVLNVRVSKRQRLSNWDADVLSEGQVDYAATDAWIPLQVFNELNRVEPALSCNFLQF